MRRVSAEVGAAGGAPVSLILNAVKDLCATTRSFARLRTTRGDPRCGALAACHFTRRFRRSASKVSVVCASPGTQSSEGSSRERDESFSIACQSSAI